MPPLLIGSKERREEFCDGSAELLFGLFWGDLALLV